jgi:YVTN family beta-propeller protein
VLAALILGSPLFAAVSGGEGVVAAATLPTPSRSTTIALTSDNRHLVAVNRETDTVSVIAVRDPQGQDIAAKFAEIPVGTEPRCVALHPNGLEAYVTNAVSGTVSVIDLFGARVLAEIPVGTDRGAVRSHRTGRISSPPTTPTGVSASSTWPRAHT